MKKLMALLLAALMLLGCAACGAPAAAPAATEAPAETAPAAEEAPAAEPIAVNAEDNLLPGGFFDGPEKDEHWGT